MKIRHLLVSLMVVGLFFVGVSKGSASNVSLGLGTYLSQDSGNVIPTFNLKVASIANNLIDIGILTNLSINSTNDYFHSLGLSVGINGKKAVESIAKKSIPVLEKLTLGWSMSYYFNKTYDVNLKNEWDNGLAGVVGLIKF